MRYDGRHAETDLDRKDAIKERKNRKYRIKDSIIDIQ